MLGSWLVFVLTLLPVAAALPHPILVHAHHLPAPAVRLLENDPSIRLSDHGIEITLREGMLLIGRIDDCQVVGQSEQAGAPRLSELQSFAGRVDWSSAPLIGPRRQVRCDRSQATVRLEEKPLVIEGASGTLFTFLFEDARNASLRRWGYFPYLVHAAIQQAAGVAVEPFAAFAAAPVPHRRLTLSIFVGLSAYGLLLVTIFLFLRRVPLDRSAAGRFFTALSTLDRKRALAKSGWSQPGMARPLGGFLLFISATLLLVGPYLYLSAILFPRVVQPFPEIDGSWAPVDEVGLLAWSFVDAGMTSAFVQRFAEQRTTAPARALENARLWLWWHLTGGFFLAGGFCFVACFVLPYTRYALLSYGLLLRGGLFLPGVLSLFTVLFQALQRFDFQMGLDLVERRLFALLFPLPLILLGRAVGRAYGESNEGQLALVGLVAGQALTLICSCAIGLAMARQLRLPLLPLLVPSFSRSTFVDAGRFGLGVVAGKAPYFLANAAEIAILTTRLPGYPAWLGIRQLLVGRLIFTIAFVWPFIDSALPTFAEAFGTGRRTLARYYVARFLQYGHVFVAIMVALLVGAGRPLLVRTLGGEWQAAADYLPLASLSGLLLPAVWLADSFQKGIGRPALNAAILVGEQLLRIVLLYLLVPRFALGGIFLATLGGLVAKSLLAWMINHRLLPLSLPFWSTFGAPLAAGLGLFGILVLCSTAVRSGSAAALFFAISALSAFPLGLFLVGLLGGLDRLALAELRDGANLASVLSSIARPLVGCARLGSRLSPLGCSLHPLGEAAWTEAQHPVGEPIQPGEFVSS